MSISISIFILWFYLGRLLRLIVWNTERCDRAPITQAQRDHLLSTSVWDALIYTLSITGLMVAFALNDFQLNRNSIVVAVASIIIIGLAIAHREMEIKIASTMDPDRFNEPVTTQHGPTSLLPSNESQTQ